MSQTFRKLHRFGCVIVIGVVVAGCASIGDFRGQTTATDVRLTQNNYKIVKVGASGDSTGFWLLGFIPIVNPKYAEAKQRLYQSVGQPLQGRSVALANQTEDKSFLYLVLFAIPKVTITADVIEFTGAARVPER